MSSDWRGRIDVMLNNAGLMPHSPPERLKIDDWNRTIDVNIKGEDGRNTKMLQCRALEISNFLRLLPGSVRTANTFTLRQR